MRSGQDFSFFRVRTSSLDLDGWGRTDYGYTVGKSIPTARPRWKTGGSSENHGKTMKNRAKPTFSLTKRAKHRMFSVYFLGWSEPIGEIHDSLLGFPSKFRHSALFCTQGPLKTEHFFRTNAQIPRVQLHCELRSQSQQSIAWLLTPQLCNRNRNNASPCSVKMIAHTQGSTVQRNVLDCLRGVKVHNGTTEILH